MTTLYGHLSRVDVASGDGVGTGERIGLVGSTGRSTGPHLHFEVRRGDRQVNPVKVMGRTFEVVIAT
jgi:murein DD-endopeptidase MepM/ murein hydrolase activator NlpD